MYEATGDPEHLAAVQGAAHRLTRLAVSVLDDETGLDWPRCEGETPTGATWCTGATGIGRFFLHAAQVDAVFGAAEVATRAARTAAHGARWLGPTQCHGLAGNIEFLIDMYQATRERSYLTEARTLAHLLEAFSVEREGVLMYVSDPPTTVTPHYMVGYAGVASCLRRLADPGRAGPDLTSPRSVRPRTSAPAPWSEGRTPRW
ncbi:MAG: lanthionine synthetase LanC family protein [Dehalococcoidia bacterium]